MQTKTFLKICLAAGLVTAVVIALYETSDQLFIYHYFKFEYYVAGIAVAALATGILLARHYFKNKTTITTTGHGLSKLTAKEARVLEQICAGRTNKEIAALNFIELSTVKTHINNIYGKLGVKNRREALRVYESPAEPQKSTLSPPAAI